MSKDYIDKLVSDIQGYLREEDEKNRTEREPDILHDLEPALSAWTRRPSLVRLITLFSACAVGSITVAILLLGALGVPAGKSVGAIWLFAGGGCGIFFSALLISAWKRLVLLSEIERNTRLILESKQAANALLEQYIKKVF